MSQHDYAIADQAGTAFLADLNAALAAGVSQNSGATEPADTYPYMLWADTTSGWLKQRNAADTAWEMRLPLACARDDVASASTLDLDAQTAHYLRITGTTTVTAVTLADGQVRSAVAQGTFQLSHGSSLVLPGAANYTTAAGDLLQFFGEATGVVRVAISPAAASQAEMEAGTEAALRSMSPLRVSQAIAALGGGGITLGTPAATTSGTQVNYTSIPAGTKRITVMLKGVSNAAGGDLAVQIGTGGTPASSGYTGRIEVDDGSGSSAFSDRFLLTVGLGGGAAVSGKAVLDLFDATNHIWHWSGWVSDHGSPAQHRTGYGYVDLSGALDIVRFISGDTLDAGAINISYE